MSYIQIRLVGGPHHRKDGWYHDQDECAPESLYVTESTTAPMLFKDTAHPFAKGPFTEYHLAGINNQDVHVYNYVPQEKP